jgi:hypothetical protein
MLRRSLILLRAHTTDECIYKFTLLTLPYYLILCCTTAQVLTFGYLLVGFAGYNLNDLYSLDPLGPNLAWTNLSRVVRGQHPSSRAYHGFVCEGRRLYVFAGQSIRMGESSKGLFAHWFIFVLHRGCHWPIILDCSTIFATLLLCCTHINLQLCRTRFTGDDLDLRLWVHCETHCRRILVLG